MATGRLWTEQEVRQALALYLVTQFGHIHSSNPAIKDLAMRLNRTTGSVALKMVNLAALDDSIRQKGMSNVSKLDRRVWAEFLECPDLVVDAYVLQEHEPKAAVDPRLGIPGFAESQPSFVGGIDVPAEGKRRVGQQFFRDMILTSYSERCALTGIDDARLLNASHIQSWSEDQANRLNPANGICLNALHDRAFDRKLITFDEDFRLVLSPHLPTEAHIALSRVKTDRIPDDVRFRPSQDFLEVHRRQFHELAKQMS